MAPSSIPDDLQSALTAALADRYVIRQELGRGGMAIVFLAEDLKHQRQVAIKVLLPELGAVLGVERFLSEIRVTATLQHPNLLPLFDSGEAGGLLYYVMPFVEGETLRARLDREQQLPVEEAVRFARTMAGALDYAHQRGVIHRDLKPENVLLQAGQPVIADFGIALAVAQAGGQRVTQTGLSLGTPQYMSPEQASGERQLDGRTDIYALGAMTYEMLTGEPPHVGHSAQAIIAKLMTEEVRPLTVLRRSVPPAVDVAVRRALEKLPADRFATAGAFAMALGDGTVSAERYLAPPASGIRKRTAAALVAVAVLMTVSTGWLLWRGRTGAGSDDARGTGAQFELAAPPGLAHDLPEDVYDLAISPNGRLLVFAVKTATGRALAVRPLEQLTARVLPGTASEAVGYPAFSPDGGWIAFDDGNGFLKKIAVDGTSLTTICKVPAQVSNAYAPLPARALTSNGHASGVTWISDKELVFTTTSAGAFRVAVDEGTPVRASRTDRAHGSVRQDGPVAVGDGRHVVLNTSTGDSTVYHVTLLDLRDSSITVFPSLLAARVLGVVEGAVVYVQSDGALVAAPISLAARTVGRPFQLADSVVVRNADAGAALAASGTLFSLRGDTRRELVRVTSGGTASPLLIVARKYAHPRLSPDGRRLAYELFDQQGPDIWVADLTLQTVERVTRDGQSDRPEWSPDGRRLLFSAGPPAARTLWEQPADGSGPAVKRLDSTQRRVREGVYSPDGRSLVYRQDVDAGERHIYRLPLLGDSTAVPIVVGPTDNRAPRVSPDGRWLAYISSESGRDEVYVRPLALGGGRVAVSAGGGSEPLWSRDGRQLFYRDGKKLLAVDFVSATPPAIGARRVLFEGPFETDVMHPNYDVYPDGSGFVMLRTSDESRRLVVELNWVAKLRQKLRDSK
jgi:serine/threonine-protein kinase